MQGVADHQSPLDLSETRSTLRQLQDETLLLALPGLCVGWLILITSARQFKDPLCGGLSATVLLLLPVFVWALRRHNYLASAWTLVFGCLAVDLLVVVWEGLHSAIYLLALPVGLAALFVSVAGGALTASVCSFLLLYKPTGLAPDPALRTIAVIGMWGTVGLIWLTRRIFSWTGTDSATSGTASCSTKPEILRCNSNRRWKTWQTPICNSRG
jgi:hypothetical protein